MRIGGMEFSKDHCHVMAILNCTPDSFSDGGRLADRDAVKRAAQTAASEGAAILDLGGESTRPGHAPVTAEEELSRVLPALEAVREVTDLPISIDTRRPEVAREALRLGAALINDVSGLREMPPAVTKESAREMAQIIAQRGAACCLMHQRSISLAEETAGDVPPDPETVLAVYLEELQASLTVAEAAGIPREKILLDPGVGFGKDQRENLLVLQNLERFGTLGYPLLLGASRKRVIGNALDLPVEDREEGTLVTSILAAQAGYLFVRVHDVRSSVRAIRMWESIRDVR